MKVDNLLGPYLYQYKKLSLPGIGLFTLDENAVLPDDSAKIKMAIEGISFNMKTGTGLDDSLVQYIKDHTGKMKSLAESDLYSFIASAFQFLNIGKAFYFEGIGTLIKNKDGAYTFTPGTVISQTIEKAPVRYSETSRQSTYNSDENATARQGAGSRKLPIILGVLATLLIIAGGVYYMYHKNTAVNNEPLPNESKTAAAPDSTAPSTTALPATTDSSGKKPDSIKTNTPADSTAVTTPAKKDSVAAPGGPVTNYTYTLETTAKKTRALKRYEMLKGVPILKVYNNKALLETKDSVSFRIYTVVACTPADTAHVKQMLNAWYYGTKEIKVKLDH